MSNHVFHRGVVSAASDRTASRSLVCVDPVAEGPEDAGDVAGAFGDVFFAGRRERDVEALMQDRLHQWSILQTVIDEDLAWHLGPPGIRQIRPPGRAAAQPRESQEPAEAVQREMVVAGHSQ